MSDETSIEMDEDTRDELLGVGGTGVISLSTKKSESPHSIPVSYGYDPATETFYFRLAADSDSEKGEMTDRRVTFVRYTEEDGKWHSIVAQGKLEPTGDEDIATETLEGLERVDIPYVDIFGKPLSDVSFRFYRLVPETFTGRKEQPTGL